MRKKQGTRDTYYGNASKKSKEERKKEETTGASIVF
jgi:hypothetical protein